MPLSLKKKKEAAVRSVATVEPPVSFWSIRGKVLSMYGTRDAPMIWHVHRACYPSRGVST